MMEDVNASRVRHIDKNHRGPVNEASGRDRPRKGVLHRSVRPARAHAALLALDLTLFWEILLRPAGIQKQNHTNDLQQRCAEKVPRMNGSRGWHQVPNGSFEPKGHLRTKLASGPNFMRSRDCELFLLLRNVTATHGQHDPTRREVHWEQNALDRRHGLRTQRRGWRDKHVLPCVIDHVLLMIDGENPSSVQFHFNGSLVAVRKPKTINPLILPNKVCTIDPEGRLLSRVAGDFHDREVVGINPYFPLEQILIFAFRSGLENEAVIWANFFLPRKKERVVSRGDCTVVVLATG